jgi:hypothetical protein
LTNQNHNFSIAVGATERLTFLASIDYSSRQREQLTQDLIFYVTEAQELGDLRISGLYNFVNSGPYRAHFNIGALIPTGSDNVVGETPFSTPNTEALPYGMRPGGGTFAFLPGVTASIQNEFASVGFQLNSTLPLGTNSQSFSVGNRFEGSGWASYLLNDQFAVSARIHWQNWGGIQGADPDLDPARDPGNDAFFLEGERVDLPFGINFVMPEDSPLAGHRISLEAIFPIHHEYTGAQLGMDWGVTAGWTVVF